MNTIGWLVANDPQEAVRQQKACAWPCEVCGEQRLPFESSAHTECDETITRGSRYGPNVFRRDGYTCAHCGVGAIGYLTIDHIVPRFRGASNEPSNLQTLCQSCNSRKGTRDGA